MLLLVPSYHFCADDPVRVSSWGVPPQSLGADSCADDPALVFWQVLLAHWLSHLCWRLVVVVAEKNPCGDDPVLSSFGWQLLLRMLQ